MVTTYICKVCGYINQYAVAPTFCVYCHSPHEFLQKYTQEEKLEPWVRKAIASYTSTPDPVTKSHLDRDSSFRAALRSAISGLKGKELSFEDARALNEGTLEKWVDEAASHYAKDPCPVGAVYEELNSALSRHYRKAILLEEGAL